MCSRNRTEDGYMFLFIAVFVTVIIVSLAMFSLLIHPSY
jgi:hypothetical protein